MAENRRSRPNPPAHLSAEAAAWWRQVLRDYELEPHHLRILQCAGEAWDRMQEARRDLATHGSLTFTTAAGTIRAHPSVGIERDCRTGFARMVRELGLDVDEPFTPTRPPALSRNRR